jgi:hypothetical protein
MLLPENAVWQTTMMVLLAKTGARFLGILSGFSQGLGSFNLRQAVKRQQLQLRRERHQTSADVLPFGRDTVDGCEILHHLGWLRPSK